MQSIKDAGEEGREAPPMKKAWALLAGIGAVLCFLAGLFLRGLFGKKTGTVESREQYQEVKDAIENTSARDLVDAAHNADELRADRDGIAERARQRFRDRCNAILSGKSGAGTPSGSGSGD